MSAASAPGRFTRARTPWLLRVGDMLALAILVYVFFLGMRHQGITSDNVTRGQAFLACGFLGAWAAAGICFGRWSGPAMSLSRWALAVFGVALVWFAIQLVPLPTSIATALSPPVRESMEAFKAAGLEPPATFPLAQTPERAARSLSQFFAFFCVLAVCCMMARRRTMALWLLLLMAGTAVLEGVLAFGHLAFGHGGRASGTLFNPVHSAALTVMGLPLATMAIIRLYEVKQSGYVYGREGGEGGSRDLRLVLFGCVIVAGLGWLATLSRGSLVAGLTAIAAWLAIEILGGLTRSQRQGTERRAEPAVPWILGASVVLLIFASNYVDLFTDRFAREGLTVGRMELTRATIEGLEESRFLGTGLGATEAMLLRHARIPTDGNPGWSHNDIAQWMAEAGVPGALLVLLALAGFGRAFWRNWQQQVAVFHWSNRALQRAAWIGIIITLVHATMDFHLRVPLVGFAFAVLLALAISDGTLHLLEPDPEAEQRPSQRRQRGKRRRKDSNRRGQTVQPLTEAEEARRKELSPS